MIDYDYGEELHTTTFGRHMSGCANPFGKLILDWTRYGPLQFAESIERAR